MSNDNKQVYGLTESEHFKIYQAHHLAALVKEVDFESLKPETFHVVMGLLRDLTDPAEIQEIQKPQA